MKKIFLAISLFVAALAGAQERGVVDISVANMRATDDYDAEMVSQALLGTAFEVLEISPKYGWPKVRTPDGYVGWIHKDAVALMSPEAFAAWTEAPKVVVTALFSMVMERPSVGAAVVSDAVGGDRMEYLGTQGCWFKVAFPSGRTGYIRRKYAMKEDQWRRQLRQDADAIIETALSMKGFPYLWGGMSPKGMDCSGFVRTVLAMHDIVIERDASQQARGSKRIEILRPDGHIDLSPLKKGDLIFFGRRETGRVSHVGFYMGDGHFIHSLGLVKVGSLRRGDPDYDAYNTGRLLFAGRIL